mgnify:CR=1 FL=1
MRLIDADELLGMLSKGYETKRALDLLPTVDQWHYPSKGEYPKYGEWVLVIAKEDACVLPPGKWVMQYFDKSENILRSDKYFANTTNSIYASKVKCWQYIVLPKEKE